MATLKLEALTKEAFAPFGEVIEIAGSDWFPINKGTTQRYHKLGLTDVVGEDCQVAISMARGDAFNFPLEVTMLERHPLGSQAFIPCSNAPFVVVVAPNGADDKPDESGLRAFWVEGNQGVNYFRGTWHHPLVTIGQVGDFIVVDRVGPGHNCDEVDLKQVYQLLGKDA
ncbi:ureidoglycolate lyase [Crenobacter sp. SG2303]|uniref:Ureidoglycolate lyase n=1 Tax=Crenobacter oryzisoli TaxID=3056844 RepID=A0ABT7XJK8_9NEIS|nr:ureidoglycolate lyase [Crenobacter sp. SG2303]MDN0073962.1 ureidoglycolate lyase [Crenobacter sp. SG2303]